MTRTILITGATAGIGDAAARRFAAGGWRVIGTGRRGDRLRALQDELGGAFLPLEIDMRDEIFEPLVWSPVIITFLTYFSYGAILTIIPDFSAFLGVTNKGLFFTFFTASSVGIRLLAGKVSDRYGRVPVLKVSALMMAGSMLMLGLAGNAALLMAAGVAYGMSVGLNSPAVTAWTVDLGKPEHRGRARPGAGASARG